MTVELVQSMHVLAERATVAGVLIGVCCPLWIAVNLLQLLWGELNRYLDRTHPSNRARR